MRQVLPLAVFALFLVNACGNTIEPDAFSTAPSTGVSSGPEVLPDLIEDSLGESAGRVEIIGERTSNSKTFQNEDGTQTTLLFANPVHHKVNDEWQERLESDTNFKAPPTGTQSRFDLEVIDSPIQIFFKEKDQNNAYSIHYVHEDLSVTWYPKGVETSLSDKSHDNVLRVDHTNQKLYEEFIAEPDHIKHNIVLTEPPLTQEGEGSFVYEGILAGNENADWFIDGKKIEKEKEYLGERLEVYSSQSKAMLVFPPLYVVDSSKNQDDILYAKYRVRKSGNQLSVQSLLSNEWLSAPHREYPVVLDPTTSLPNACANNAQLTGYVWYFSDGRRWEKNYEAVEGIKTGLQSANDYYRGYAEWDLSFAPPANQIGDITRTRVYLKARYFNDANRDGSMSTRFYHMNSRPSASSGDTVQEDAGNGNYYGYIQWFGLGRRNLDLGAAGNNDLKSRFNNGNGWFAVGLKPWDAVDPNDQVFFHSNRTSCGIDDFPTLEFTYNNPGPARDPFEPDDNSGQATLQALNSDSAPHSISPVGDQDWIRFVLNERSNVTIETIQAAGNADTRMWLYNSNVNELAYNDDDGDGNLSRIQQNNLATGTYYVKIDEYGNNATIDFYSISLSAEAAPLPGDPYEPDNNSGQATLLDHNATHGGHSIVPANDQDWFRIVLNQTSDITLSTVSVINGADTRMWLYDVNVNEIAYNDDGNGNLSRIERNNLPPGTYYAKVDEYNNDNIIEAYGLELTVVVSNIPPVAALTAPNNGNNVSTENLLIRVEGNCQDGNGNLNFIALENLTNGDGFSPNLNNASNQPFAADIGLNVGDNTVRATCRDASGASSTDSMVITRIDCSDPFEPDNNENQASFIANNSNSAVRTICPVNDQDWFRFVINRPSLVTLETDGPQDGDTRMWLHDSNVNEIEFDDDDGDHGNFSKISRFLDAGTYYVKIDEFGNNNTIGNYHLELDVVADPAPFVTFNGPDDNTSTLSSPIRVWGNCNDNGRNLSSVTVRNDTTGWSQNANINGAVVSFDANVGLRPGWNTMQVTCNDSAGQSGTATRRVFLDVCQDGSQRDNVGNACIHNDCPDFSIQDNYQNVCLHDEDGDGVHDDQDACPGFANDPFNNPCDSNDNVDFSFEGNAIDVDLIHGTTGQTQQFTIRNNGNSNLVYDFELLSVAPWFHLVKNGGNTDALFQEHQLPPGQIDRYTASLNVGAVDPGVTVNTTLRIHSNDPSNGTNDIQITLTALPAPFCDGVCATPPEQLLGNNQLTTHTVSDPVNTATGNFAHHHDDLKIDARGLDLLFSRTYNSQDEYLGPLGYGWTHSYNIFLINRRDGSVLIKWHDGHSEVFIENVDGTYQSPTGVFSTLTDNNQGGYNLTTKEKIIFIFSGEGQLTEVEDRNGNNIHLAYDQKDRLISVSHLTGKELTFHYIDEENLNLQQLRDSSGRSVSFAYNNDNLISVTDAGGNTTGYSYDNNHQLTNITDPLGNTALANVYDEDSRVIEQRDAFNRRTQINYSEENIGEVNITNPLNQVLRQIYDNNLRIVESADPAGEPMRYQYNALNLRSQVTDREEKGITARYDIIGNLTELTDVFDGTTSFTYDDNHLLILTRLPNGQERRFEYDNENNLTRAWEMADGEPVENTFTYNEWGQILSASDPEGNRTQFEYDNPTGNLITMTRSDGGITRLEYDNLNRVIAVTDALNDRTLFGYNLNGQQTRIHFSDDREIQLEHDANQNLTALVDRAGNRTEYLWNGNRMLTAVRNALGQETTFTYDALNRRTSVTRPDNQTTSFTYTPAGYLESVTDPLGHRIIYGYNRIGQLVSKTNASGHTWRYAYNGRGEMVSVTDPLGNRAAHQYDPTTGSLTGHTSPGGISTGFAYDSLNRLAETVDPLDQTIRLVFNKVNQLEQLTHANGQNIEFAYDSLGRKIAERNGLGDTLTAGYNAGGKLTRLIHPNGEETGYTYDSLGRLSTITSRDDNIITFTYDANGNRLTMTDASGVTRYTYDALDRLTSVTDVHGLTIQYTYNTAGLLTELIYPENKTVTYTYNAAKKLIRVADWRNHVTQYDYDNGKRLQRITLPNGFTTEFIYDAASRPIEQINRKADGTVLTRYQITSDADGNRIGIDREGELTPWYLTENVHAEFNVENSLLRRGGTEFEYDANGNLVAATEEAISTEYAYDTHSRLLQINRPGAPPVRFRYNGEGQRISKVINETTTQYLINPNKPLPDLLATTDGQGNIQHYYIYGLGLISQISGDETEVRYYHFDPTGSTVALSNGNGEVTDQYLYDPFGKRIRRVGNAENPFQYAGQFGIQNDETGLYYMRARYYSPDWGRFITKDPNGYRGELNLYSYAGNNPVGLIDPAGEYISPLDALDYVSLGMSVADVWHDPTNPWNWGFLALDVVGTVIPGLGGFGFAAKTAKYGDDFIDAAKYGDAFASQLKRGEKIEEVVTNDNLLKGAGTYIDNNKKVWGYSVDESTTYYQTGTPKKNYAKPDGFQLHLDEAGNVQSIDHINEIKSVESGNNLGLSDQMRRYSGGSVTVPSMQQTFINVPTRYQITQGADLTQNAKNLFNPGQLDILDNVPHSSQMLPNPSAGDLLPGWVNPARFVKDATSIGYHLYNNADISGGITPGPKQQ